MATRRRIHVLYEHGGDGVPYGSSCIRLLQPLSHPVLRADVSLASGTEYKGQATDAVIVDRGWRPDVTPAECAILRKRVHDAGARLVLAIDDNLLELVNERKDWTPTSQFLRSVEYLLTYADGVLVTTENLKRAFAKYNQRIVVLPNMLDDRLLSRTRRLRMIHLSLRAARDVKRRARREPVVIGYMGTLTHDDDLMMILPALDRVCRHYAGQLVMEFVGGIARPTTVQALASLPIRYVSAGGSRSTYPRFVRWFSLHAWWDMVLAPLKDTPFNQCKSDIKFLDYASVAAAGIYSRVPAYATSVRHRQTGMLVDNSESAWIDALEELMENRGLRRAIGMGALGYLLDKRIVARQRREWLDALASLLS